MKFRSILLLFKFLKFYDKKKGVLAMTMAMATRTAIGLFSKTTCLHRHHTFLYIS